MAYVFVTGGVKVTALITVEDSIKINLRWIVFTTEDQRDSIYDDSINSFSDIMMLTKRDISNLSTEFYGRTQGNGNIHFGMRRTEKTKTLLHRVQYFIVSQEILPLLIWTKSCLLNSHKPLCTRQRSKKKLIDQ